MPITLDGTSGVVTPAIDLTTPLSVSDGGTGLSTGEHMFRNRIINGAMMIDQRNAGASVTNAATGLYTLDRWQSFGSASSKFTVQQNAGSVTPPAGFRNYLGCTSSSSYTVGASETFVIFQNIEGFNTADLNFGTANAQTVTLSFWVRSSLTGTFGGGLRNQAENRSYPFSYTISSANTWEYKTITISGDTTGTWIGATNGTGLGVLFSLGTGSTFSGAAGAWASGNFISTTGTTSVVGTNGATFYITGVQLEKGSTATSFDYRPYTTELQLCQRYYAMIGTNVSNNPFAVLGVGRMTSATSGSFNFSTPVTMRTAPSASLNGTLSVLQGTTTLTPTAVSFYTAQNNGVEGDITVSSGGTNGSMVQIRGGGGNPFITLSAEL